jgi:biopolymer transport protein ExbD
MVESGFEGRKARIEMLPILDVVFLLLVFFIFAMLSMVTQKGVRVSLPAVSSSEKNVKDYINITITESNAIYIGEERIALGDVALHVKEHLKANDKTPVFIRGDRRASLGVGIALLDKLRGAGLKSVSFEVADKGAPH